MARAVPMPTMSIPLAITRSATGRRRTPPVLQGAAPPVVPAIGERRQEPAQQVAVGRVDLDAGEACRFGEARVPAKPDHLVDGLLRHRAGSVEMPGHAASSRGTADGAQVFCPRLARIWRPG